MIKINMKDGSVQLLGSVGNPHFREIFNELLADFVMCQLRAILVSKEIDLELSTLTMN